MKNMKRFLAIITVLLIILCSFSATVSAKNDYELYQKSIVMIQAQVSFTGANTGISFSRTGSGTGFAVGIPGKPVQYIATCNHVVNEPEGVYMVLADPRTGQILEFFQMEDGTETGAQKTRIDGVEYMAYVDYFKTKPVEIIALYSGATGDHVSLTVAQVDENADIALCKLASEPTEKITPMPVQFKDSVNPNTEVVAVGFPGMTMEINAEMRLDGSDSTIKDGRIGKKQRTASLFDEKVMIDTYQLTAATSQGMSGGPVISEETNAVIGVVAFSYLDQSQLKTDDYAVCIDYLKPLLERENIEYKVYGQGGIALWLILLIAVIVLAVGAVVVFVVLKGKKKAVPTEGVQNGATTPVGSSGKNYLIGISGYMAGKRFAVPNRAVIGRDSTKCNVVYPADQPGVSGVHCELKFEGSVFILKDCGSSYGTFIADGTKLEPHVGVVLSNGAKFWIGTKENLFEVKY